MDIDRPAQANFMKLSCPLDPDKFPAAFALFEAAREHKPRGSRISAASIAAMCLLAGGEVRFAREAAKIAGITEANFSRSRRSSHGRSLEKTLAKLFRENAGQCAIANIVKLANQRENLSVAMRANEWLAGINGISPATKSEVTHKSEGQNFGMVVMHPDLATPDILDQIFPKRRDKPTKY
ncbi:hypothetical protein [Thalassococcus lentus]|uniref:Uncharacterized protein n=1 Tax=Thalassococcus lentus TaxID=1210524 RepID=A0ABT4XPD9_9RHOB|nr:hypothetical protein [Thalassococcus lentus]MDA7423818.1 hypothetical protein [Thalassococcus lentus]